MSVKKIIELFFPMWANCEANKIIQKKIDENVEPELDIANNQLLDAYIDSLEQKKTLEDKAKVNVIGVTIAFTLMLNSTAFISNSLGMKFGKTVLIISIVTILLAAIYMIFAGILVIKVLTDKNVVYYYCGKCESETEYLECKRAIYLNRKMNLIRNNYVFTTYECIRNSLVCFFCVFVIACIALWPVSKNTRMVSSEKNSDYLVYYTTDSLIEEVTDIGIVSIEDSIIDFIQKNKIELDQTFSFINQEYNLFIKAELKNEEVFVIDIEHYLQ